MLDKVNMPISNTQIINFLLENDYTDYLNAQQTLAELIEDECVYLETIRNMTLYAISPAGRESLALLGGDLSKGIREDIDTYLREKSIDINNAIAVRADYYIADHDLYIARLQLVERGAVIFEMNVSLPTAEIADTVCANWRNASGELYANVMATLMK